MFRGEVEVEATITINRQKQRWVCVVKGSLVERSKLTSPASHVHQIQNFVFIKVVRNDDTRLGGYLLCMRSANIFEPQKGDKALFLIGVPSELFEGS